MLSLAVHTQERKELTAKDYEQTQRFLLANAEQLVDHGSVRPVWLSSDRFWYRDLMANGSQFILVEPVKGTRSLVFDHQKLANAL